MLQCRSGKRTGRAALQMAVDMVDEGLIDEKTAVEKRTASYQLVQASDFKGALTTFLEGMNDTMADFEIASITETPLMDVFPVDLEETRADREARQKAQNNKE